MKDLIKKILKEETEEVLEIPSLNFFPDGIDGLKNFIEKKNITRWSLDDNLDLRRYKDDLTWFEGLVSISGYLDLRGTQIKDLGNLQFVGDYLDLYGSQIESLENLQSVGDYLDTRITPIKSLPKLKSVGSILWLNKYVFKKYTDKKIRNMVDVGGKIVR
jgi:hypothetical protein